jgi:hypothetical protein
LPKRGGTTARAPVSLDEVRTLVQRAQMGDRTAAPRLRVLFDRDPEPLMKLGGGDIAASVKALLVDKDIDNDILAREARLRQVDRIRDELAGPRPTPIERLLADRAALCWFELHSLDARVIRLRGEDGEGRSADDLDRHRDRAQRRYFAALRTLALVRRLAVPLLQVNVAQNQQINQSTTLDGSLAGRPG